MQPILEKSIGVDGAVFADRRSEVRRRVLKAGVLSFNRGFSSFECVIRNLSDNGARLSLGETFALPTSFSLRLDGAAPRTATVRWRTEDAMGVAFSKG